MIKGINNFSFPRMDAASRPMALLMEPVSMMIAKEPPVMKTNNVTLAAAFIPVGYALINSNGVTGLFST